ncbi:MAG: pyridoxamine 5'-phosphate oxidase family protein [Alphaproteobacteria bacterium]
MGKLSMSRTERETFLADLHVGVISIAEDGRGPLAIPIWYAYEPGGEVRIVTGADSRKLDLLRRAGRFTLCVQDETPPYRYVSVEGPVVAIEAASVEADERPLAHRYLGSELGDAYVAATTAEAGPGNVLVRMRPQRWATVDYRKEYGVG